MYIPVDRPRSRLSCLGDRRSMDRLRSPDRDRRRGGGDSSAARRSFLRRSFSFIICSNAANGSSIIPVPILLATPWNAVATIFDSERENEMVQHSTLRLLTRRHISNKNKTNQMLCINLP